MNLKISDLQEGPEREALVQQFGEDADVMTLAKSFIDTKKKLSSTMRTPSADATPEERAKFYTHLGRPASPDAYELPDAPDAVRPVIEKLRAVAYEKGLTQEQFAALASQAGAVSAEANEQVAAARKAWEEKIREQHGEKANDRLSVAQKQLDDLLAGDEVGAQLIKNAGLDRHPALINLMLKVNNAMGEDSTPNMNASPPADTGGPSAMELRKEASQIMASESYKSGQRHPDNNLAISRLHEINAHLVQMGFKGIADPQLANRATVNLPGGRSLTL